MLYFYFNSTVLGFIEKTEQGYLYTSIAPNEQRYRYDYSFRNDYSLFDSINRESDVLFPEFKRFLFSRRSDTLERAKIDATDSEWIKLVKLSKLNWFPSGFYVQDKLNETRQKGNISQTNDDNTW